MNFFSSIPPEILSQIFKSCDEISDILSLASTCKHLSETWKAHHSSVIWALGRDRMAFFDDALMAVRATQIVKAARMREELPPTPFSLRQLCGREQLPTLDEFRKVLGLKHLIDCVEYIYLSDQDYLLDHEYEYKECLPKDPVYELAWKENFGRAICRVIIAGAYFARTYQEPLYVAREDGYPDFLKYLSLISESELLDDFDQDLSDQEKEKYYEEMGGARGGVTISDKEYLKQFPIYKMQQHMLLESTFGPFVEWLEEESRERSGRKLAGERHLTSHETDKRRRDRFRSDIPKNIFFKEVQQFMSAFTFLTHHAAETELFINENRKTCMGRYRRNNERDDVMCDLEEFRELWTKVEVIILGVFQVEEIILFRVFQVEEISLPKSIEYIRLLVVNTVNNATEQLSSSDTSST